MIPLQFAQSSPLFPSSFLAAQILHPDTAGTCHSRAQPQNFLPGFRPFSYSSKTNLHTRAGGQERPQCFLPTLGTGFKSF